jgi:hypothetical protein
LDQLGAWRVELSLAELKAFADCASPLPQTNQAIFIHRITGASPEPNASTLTGTQGAINGTVPVSTGITGCDLSAVAHTPSELKAPTLSGGPGGGYKGCCGLGYGSGSAYDEGSTGASVGVVPGDTHEPPNYGEKPGLSKRHPWAYDGPKSFSDYAERERRGK